jgi:hypothetical protein
LSHGWFQGLSGAGLIVALRALPRPKQLPELRELPELPEGPLELLWLQHGADGGCASETAPDFMLVRVRVATGVGMPAQRQQPQLVRAVQKVFVRKLAWLGHHPSVLAGWCRPLSLQVNATPALEEIIGVQRGR